MQQRTDPQQSKQRFLEAWWTYRTSMSRLKANFMVLSISQCPLLRGTEGLKPQGMRKLPTQGFQFNPRWCSRDTHVGFLTDLNKGRSQAYIGCPSWCFPSWIPSWILLRLPPLASCFPQAVALAVANSPSHSAISHPLSPHYLPDSSVTAPRCLHPCTMIVLRAWLSPKFPDKE